MYENREESWHNCCPPSAYLTLGHWKLSKLQSGKQKLKTLWELLWGLQVSCSLVREGLPLVDQHLLPDDLPHHLLADAPQHWEWAPLVVKALKQHLGHLSLLLPAKIRESYRLRICQMLLLPIPLLSCLPRLQQDFQALRFVPERNVRWTAGSYFLCHHNFVTNSSISTSSTILILPCQVL